MKIVVAITGASGAIYAQSLITALKKGDHDLHVVASRNARTVYKTELDADLDSLHPDIKSPQDFDVPYVSGSARLDAMVIVPCSMGTVGRIACGISNDAISRAADVFIKERRQLILVTREMPLSTIHLRNLLTLSEAGALVLPASPTFYGRPDNVGDVVATVTARILDQLKIAHKLINRWHDHDK